MENDAILQDLKNIRDVIDGAIAPLSIDAIRNYSVIDGAIVGTYRIDQDLYRFIISGNQYADEPISSAGDRSASQQDTEKSGGETMAQDGLSALTDYLKVLRSDATPAEKGKKKREQTFHEWGQGELNIGKSEKKVPKGEKGYKQAIALSQEAKAIKSAQRSDAFPSVKLRKTIASVPVNLTHKVGDIRFPDSDTRMISNYGFIPGTYGKGLDGKALDIYVGVDPSEDLYRVNQIDPETGELDEHKYATGYLTPHDAQACYMYHAGAARFGGIEPADWAEIMAMRGQDLEEEEE